MNAEPRPPAILRVLIRACLPPEDKAVLISELDGLFAERAARTDRGRAILWYVRQALGFVLRVGAARVADTLGRSDEYLRDARLAIRHFRRRPSYAGTAVLTLAVGTGVLSTVYAAADSLLLREVPGVAEPAGLMTLRLGSTEAPPHVSWDISHPDFMTLRDRLPVEGRLAAFTPIEVDLRPSNGLPRRVDGEMVTANFFEVLRHQLAAGRAFGLEDEQGVAELPVVVISHELARRFNTREADAVGADLRVNGVVFRVIGVASAGFHGPDLPGRAELWMPLAALRFIDPSSPRNSAAARGYGIWQRLVARPRPGTPLEQIAADANSVMDAVRREHRRHSFMATHFVIQVFPGIGLDPGVRATVRQTLGLLSAASLFLLALAMANLANLALIESTTRATAHAVRVALGASRVQMIRGVAVEILLLAGGGSVAALCLSTLWSRWFQASQLSEYGGSLAGIAVGGRVVFVTIGTVVLAAAIALLKPLAGRGQHAIDALLRRSRTSTPAGNRLRMTLAGVQVAISVVLLVTAGLLGGSVDNLRRIDLGFRPERLLAFSVDPHLHGYEGERLTGLTNELEQHLAAEPGVRGAGFISPSPLRSSYFTASLRRIDAANTDPIRGAGYYVTPGFLEALEVRLAAGDRHWNAQPGTIVMTRSVLARLLPGAQAADVIGLIVHDNQSRPVRIAAVIEDVRLSDVTREPPPTIFRPLADRPAGASLSGFVSTSLAPMQLAPAVGRVMAARAPELPVFNVRTAREAVDLQFAEVTTLALAARTLSVIGIALAAIGLYGVLSNAVAARRREIGIRAALGASPAKLLAGVVFAAAIPIALGLGAGLVGAAAASRLLAHQLFGLSPADPLTYVRGVALIVLVGLAAAAIPAFRASLVSPVAVLREE
jgi:predicted permease